ncbi:hypothetical protein [Vibrio profundi]|uniref:Cap15 family cyclic dinucleotide receptor domain-containing protein n=1 Tax=Vibrio profundi TaxID=1774960 RepID=UPI003736924C
MWKVFPKFGLAKIMIFLICTLATLGVIWVTKGWSGINDFLKEDGFNIISRITVPVLLTFAALVWLIGTYLWRLVWRFPYLGTKLLNQNVCPDLNGDWTGEVISTYKDKHGDPIKKNVNIVIKASLFSFDIRLVSDDQYQRSTVVQSEIYKDQRDGSFYLSYIFESVIDQPESTDDSKFDGSAKLHIRFEDDTIKLVGVYWTNRCWQKGLQTAGKIELQKSK